MRCKIKFIMLLCVMIISFNNSFCQTSKNDVALIEDVIEKFFDSIEKKDKDTFISLFVEEKVSWVGKGKMGAMYGSPEGFIDMLVAGGDDYKEEYHNLKIWNDEQIAAVTFDYGFVANNNVMNWGKESWMLIKNDDDWKITSVNFSIILPHEKPYPFK